MDFINIIGTLFDNSINHIVALAHQIKDLRLNKNLLDINEDVYQKIDEIDKKLKKSKGYYSSFSSLQTFIPNPEIGDWAVVQNGDKQLICVCQQNGNWILTTDEYKEELLLDEYPKKNDFKTINNQSIIGEGNIEITGILEDVPIVTSQNNGLMSKESYILFSEIINSTIPTINNKINSILLLLNEDLTPENILEIINRYNIICDFINSLGNTENERIFELIITNLNQIQTSLNLEIIRALGKESEILLRIVELENNSFKEKTKHIFITLKLYDVLLSYEKDTLYLIIENISGSKLGDTFPFILGGNEGSKFGDNFPLIFN